MSSRKRQSRAQRENALKGGSGETKTASPFHVLMVENGVPLDATKLKLNGRLKRDYLSKRHRLLQMCKPVAQREGETFWSGATPVELSLLSCCELPKQNTRYDDYVVAGALNRAKIPKFIGLAAVDCHELSTRSLALAILERTWEADEEAKDLLQAYTEDGNAVSPNKKSKMNDGSSTLAKIGMKGKADRLLVFFAGGGLRILNQWLVEASTPIFSAPPKRPPGEEKGTRSKRNAMPAASIWKPSKTGELLIALLVLLTYSPFDKDLVTESKINKQIGKLSKTADALMTEAQQQKSKVDLNAYTDPKVGGLVVKTVQKCLNDLKSFWRAKEKQKSSSASEEEAPSAPEDPFAAIKASLSARLQQAKKFEAGEGEKPEWLAKAEEQQQQKKAASAAKSTAPPRKRASTEELARLEREKERQERMKGDLKKAAAERAKLLEKLRQMKQKKMQQQQEQEQNHEDGESNKKRVKWKDGMGSTSKLRKRDLLEEVHWIANRKDAAA